jgi:hypothetical protein
MVDCQNYSRSLINNLSLISNLVLTPTHIQILDLCRYLRQLQIDGLQLDNLGMEELIYGSPRLNKNHTYLNIKTLVTRISIKREN